MRILIAEDDFTSRSILTAILKKWGYDPVVTEDGEAAWDALQQPDAPRLVLLDWNMPGMDGLEVCRRLREHETPNPPYVILLTGRGEKGDIVQGLEAGANDYVAKPYDNEELQARIRVGQRMLELQAQPAGSAGRPGAPGDARSPDRHLQPPRHPGPAGAGDFAGEAGRRELERRHVRHRPFQEDQRHLTATRPATTCWSPSPGAFKPDCGNTTVSAATAERSSS